MPLNPADPHDMRFVIVDVANNSPNKGEFFAVDPNNAPGVPIPAFRTGPSLPTAGTQAGEGFFQTIANRGYVWTGTAWQDVTPNPIKSYATDAALLADTGQTPGTYATTQDTGNLYIKMTGAWKQLNARQYATVAAMVADAPPPQTIAEVSADGSLWEYRNPGTGLQWVCSTLREFPDLAGVQGWTTGTNVGDQAVALDNGIHYMRFAGGWKPLTIWEETEAHIRAATWPLDGQQAFATDTSSMFIRRAGQWVEDPIQHYPTDALLQAATPPDGTLAWADDSSNVYARAGGQWKGMNTGFADPIPIGTISAMPSRTMPAGWLECDGSAVPAGAQYAELRTLLGAGNNLPDLRGEFLRGVKAGDTPLSHIDWTTGRPKTPFTTDITGVHDHQASLQQKTVGWTSGSPFKVMANNTHDPEGSNAGPVRTDRQGGHQHRIDGGGDAETAPDHTLIVWCIKAAHSTVPPTALNMSFAETNPQNGDVLTYVTANADWENKPGFNPTLATPTEGDILIYNATSGIWYNTPNRTIPHAIASPTEGQTLTYSARDSAWKNTDPLKVLSMTQTAYDALPTKDATTLYLITGP